MTAAELRPATRADLPAIVTLIADDQLGSTRESLDDLTPYETAFAALEADPNQLLMVADRNGEVVGTFQLTFIPGLSRRGATRSQIEAVRVAASTRGTGLGRTMMQWAITESRRRGCSLVQLTSDKSRTDAHRFYTNLGFTMSHEGFKLTL
ncbi:GNAT family N-acetyltransferase [Kribbella sp. NPDC051770]|uniref:GNAT family N-acetyltransferase n=1 Tax=Kribbella sp. NPDC051770 TaxID=3155413 RepID=UPI003447FEAD